MQQDAQDRERQARALAAAGMAAERMSQNNPSHYPSRGLAPPPSLGHPSSNNLTNANHISDNNESGHHDDPLLAWNNLENERGPTLEEMEMDFAKLFDPAMEWQNMQTEGSGWPTLSGGDAVAEPKDANGDGHFPV
jgi:hypothetical protein